MTEIVNKKTKKLENLNTKKVKQNISIAPVKLAPLLSPTIATIITALSPPNIQDQQSNLELHLAHEDYLRRTETPTQCCETNIPEP